MKLCNFIETKHNKYLIF